MFNRPLIAIDIGSSALKVVELSGQGTKVLRAVGLETLPVGTVVDGVVQNHDLVTSILKDLLKKLKISTVGRRAAISLGGSAVIIKRINVTLGKDISLPEQVYYEAEQHFQADMSEIYFDFYELRNTTGNTDETPILLVGAKRDLVEQYISIVRSVGLRTGIVECDVFSAANMFEYNYGQIPGLVSLINVGASATQISLLLDGEYVFTRDIPLGGDEYTRQIMDAMQVDHGNAESLKIAAGQSPEQTPEEVKRIFSEVNDQLVNEVYLSIDYFTQSGEFSDQMQPLHAAFLVGGGSRLAGFDAAMAATLQVPIQVVNPFQKVTVNPKKFQMEYLAIQGHLYGVAVGLGLRMLKDNH